MFTLNMELHCHHHFRSQLGNIYHKLYSFYSIQRSTKTTAEITKTGKLHLISPNLLLIYSIILQQIKEKNTIFYCFIRMASNYQHKSDSMWMMKEPTNFRYQTDFFRSIQLVMILCVNFCNNISWCSIQIIDSRC